MNVVTITVPDTYYQTLAELRELGDTPGCNREVIYYRFCDVTDNLTRWLYRHAPGAYKVSGPNADRQVSLRSSDNPFDCYWTETVVGRISDESRLGGWWDRRAYDP